MINARLQVSNDYGFGVWASTRYRAVSDDEVRKEGPCTGLAVYTALFGRGVRVEHEDQDVTEWQADFPMGDHYLTLTIKMGHKIASMEVAEATPTRERIQMMIMLETIYRFAEANLDSNSEWVPA